MNRHMHRVVFNAARGIRMAVQETATSIGRKASGATPGTLALATQSTEFAASASSAGRDLVWQKNKGQGVETETLHYNQLHAGQLAIDANRVQAGLGAKDSIDSLAKQPGMAWVGQLHANPAFSGKVDWVKIETAHRDWKYDKQGLTPEGAAVVAAVVTYFTAGTGAGLGSSIAGTVGATGTTATVISGAVAAGVTTLSSQAAIAVINNRGDLGAALEELGSSANVKSLAAAIVTGGVLGGLNMNPNGLPTAGTGAQPFVTQLQQNLTAGAAKAVIGTAINGGSLEENLRESLKGALLDTVAAQGANAIGDMNLDGFTNKVAHAIAGCAVGAGRSDGGCAAGALGSVIGEISGESFGFDDNGNPRPRATEMAAMLGAVAGAIAGLDAEQIDIAASAAANTAANNALRHYVERALDKLADGLKAIELKPLVEKQQLVREYLEKASARGGLTELELSTLGVMYAANEVLFPTSLLDAMPGLGKVGTLVKAGAKAEDAAKVVAAEARVSNATPGSIPAHSILRAEQFEKDIAKLPPGERVALVKQEVKELALERNWVKDSRLSRMNDRDVYRTPDGDLYSIDTQHGRLEKINPKTGTHEGEYRLLDIKAIDNSTDHSGGHNLRIK